MSDWPCSEQRSPGPTRRAGLPQTLQGTEQIGDLLSPTHFPEDQSAERPAPLLIHRNGPLFPRVDTRSRHLGCPTHRQRAGVKQAPSGRESEPREASWSLNPKSLCIRTAGALGPPAPRPEPSSWRGPGRVTLGVSSRPQGQSPLERCWF